MRVKFNIYSAAEFNAFSAFCTEMAKVRENEKSQEYRIMGGIDHARSGLWTAASEVERDRVVAALKEKIGAHDDAADALAGGDAAVFVTNTPRAGETEAQTAARRERGQPSPGKARRTKAEIAEDEAADKADAGNIVDESGQSSGMSIATGEERISPEDEADAAVDAADEAAETEATGGLVPRERLRKALGALGIKAGVEAVKPGGLLGMAVQDVPEDQIEAAIAKLEAAKAAPVEQKVVTPVPATKDELMAAMLDYAEIFDGTRDPKKAVLASEDCGKVFKLIFGDEVASMSKVPAEQYDKAIAGIREAITKNPYDRERKG